MIYLGLKRSFYTLAVLTVLSLFTVVDTLSTATLLRAQPLHSAAAVQNEKISQRTLRRQFVRERQNCQAEKIQNPEKDCSLYTSSRYREYVTSKIRHVSETRHSGRFNAAFTEGDNHGRLNATQRGILDVYATDLRYCPESLRSINLYEQCIARNNGVGRRGRRAYTIQGLKNVKQNLRESRKQTFTLRDRIRQARGEFDGRPQPKVNRFESQGLN